MKNKLVNYIRAAYPALYIVGYEEQRIEAEVKAAADERGYSFNVWSLTKGIVNPDDGMGSGCEDPIDMLSAFEKLPQKSVLVCRDLHLHIGADANPFMIRKLKDVLCKAKANKRVLVVTGCRLTMPPELEKEITVIEFKLPTKEQLLPVLQSIAGSAGIELNGNTDPVLDACRGGTSIEAENWLAESVIQFGDFKPDFIAHRKAETVRKNGILEIIETKTGLADIGGLDVLKAWLGKRKHSFSKAAQEYGLPSIKGCLTVGIPGSGKSLTAKATSNILGVPLLKLDGGKIFGSLVGESERNLRTAIETAEAVAPCVLWVDEIEKAFSGSKSSGSTDGGTSARVFGTFLQWMNDKTASVFVFATANDVTALPPEFLRKGRFDELFFVDLPDLAEREAIWSIQITKRGRNPVEFDLACLANSTEGFTGAEIEAAFTEAMFSAFDASREPVTTDVLDAIRNTVPLSKTMAPQITALKDWAKGRARRASSPTAAESTGRKLS